MLLIKKIFSNAYLNATKAKLRVICYHRVNRGHDYFSIDTGVFEKQIEFLAKHYSIISFQEFFNVLEGRKDIRKGLLITFDDGYHDFYSDAYPILEKYSAPAVVFLTTNFINQKMWMWQDLYRYIFSETLLKSFDFNGNGVIPINSNLEIMNARKIIHEHCVLLGRKDRLDFLINLAKKLNVKLTDAPPKDYAAMNWDEVRELSGKNIEFGAHTHRHEILSCLNIQDIQNEISKSKILIEKNLNKPVSAFAYPNGSKQDFSDEAKSVVKENGFKCAFTMVRGLNDQATDKFELKRFSNPRNFDRTFNSQLSGINQAFTHAN
ncbi:MAG: polysaccharide deacetylase family protein [Calditrichaceae bacterium]